MNSKIIFQLQFYQIISNPNESYQQKQSKLDQLVLSLSSKNQVGQFFAIFDKLFKQEIKVYVRSMPLQELYDQYRKRKDMEEREKRERIHAIVANMSNKAQTVFAKVLYFKNICCTAYGICQL